MGDREREDSPRFGEGDMIRRPSVSAWVAMISAAAALFALGAFIKTNRNMEDHIRETQREMRELRLALENRDAAEALPELSSLDRGARGTAPLPDPVAMPPSIRRVPESAPSIRINPSLSYLPAELAARDNPPVRISPAPAGQQFPAPPRPVAVPASGAVAFAPRPVAASSVLAVSLERNRVMVSGGEGEGMKKTMRLTLSRNNRRIGTLQVSDVFDSMSVCEILEAFAAPEIGDAAHFAVIPPAF